MVSSSSMILFWFWATSAQAAHSSTLSWNTTAKCKSRRSSTFSSTCAVACSTCIARVFSTETSRLRTSSWIRIIKHSDCVISAQPARTSWITVKWAATIKRLTSSLNTMRNIPPWCTGRQKWLTSIWSTKWTPRSTSGCWAASSSRWPSTTTHIRSAAKSVSWTPSTSCRKMIRTSITGLVRSSKIWYMSYWFRILRTDQPSTSCWRSWITGSAYHESSFRKWPTRSVWKTWAVKRRKWLGRKRRWVTSHMTIWPSCNKRSKKSRRGRRRRNNTFRWIKMRLSKLVVSHDPTLELDNRNGCSRTPRSPVKTLNISTSKNRTTCSISIHPISRRRLTLAAHRPNQRIINKSIVTSLISVEVAHSNNPKAALVARFKDPTSAFSSSKWEKERIWLTTSQSKTPPC